MARFYVDLPLALGVEIELPAEVVRHVVVLRIRSHESITLFNGNGNDYLARVLELGKRQVRVAITQVTPLQNESPLQICLLMALIANERFDWVVQKAVELGVTRLVPIYTQNVQRFKADKATARLVHWQKIGQAASEQSGRASLLEISLPEEFSGALTQVTAQHKWILSPHAAGAEVARLADTQPQNSLSVHELSTNQATNPASKKVTAAVVVGPEGGFTCAEIALAQQHGYDSRLIGPRILRAETAAVVGVSCLQNTYGDFKL